MTNTTNEITNEQLEAWAGLADKTLLEQFEGLPNWTVVPQLAAALLAERKAREVEVAKLKAAIQDIAENWKWWDEDRYDRCSSVVGDSIAEAEQALKGGERS